jgi:hypothetical protein
MQVRASTVLAGLGLFLFGCTPMRMGETQVSLSRLQEKQDACDAKMDAPLTLDDRSIAECLDTSNALAALAQEMAQEAGKANTSRPDAVFFYRRAATAAWRSEQPKSMQDAIGFARATMELCADRSRSEIAPGDCGVVQFIEANVTHDRAMLAFRRLKADIDAKLPSERKPIYLSDSPTPLAGAAAELNTQLGNLAQRAFEGWSLTDKAAPAICSIDMDPTVRQYATALRKRMGSNLKSLYDAMNATLPFGSSYSEGNYDAACRPESGGVTITPLPGRNTLEDRVNLAAWCRWRTIVQSKPEPCL